MSSQLSGNIVLGVAVRKAVSFGKGDGLVIESLPTVRDWHRWHGEGSGQASLNILNICSESGS